MYFPITSMLLVSLRISKVLSLLRRWWPQTAKSGFDGNGGAALLPPCALTAPGLLTGVCGAGQVPLGGLVVNCSPALHLAAGGLLCLSWWISPRRGAFKPMGQGRAPAPRNLAAQCGE